MKDEAGLPDEAEADGPDAGPKRASRPALEALEALDVAIRFLDYAASRLWISERHGEWLPAHNAWESVGNALRHLRTLFPSAGTLNALHQLLAARSDWSHPSQILDQPRPEYRELADLARHRGEMARGEERRQLREVVIKLERAAEMEERARRRRLERRPPQP